MSGSCRATSAAGSTASEISDRGAARGTGGGVESTETAGVEAAAVAEGKFELARLRPRIDGAEKTP